MGSISRNPTHMFLRNYNVSIGASNFGLVGEVKVLFDPITLGKDSLGRTIVGGMRFEASWQVMQDTHLELKALADNLKNGVADTLTFSTLGEKLLIPGVKPYYKLELDGNGGNSKLLCRADKIMSIDEFYNIMNSLPNIAP
ncbi:MAG: hypothetical protein Kow0037_00610 [Calditrichia bacterium]